MGRVRHRRRLGEAKDAARAMVGIYASSMPAEQLERNGVNPVELKPIIDAIGAGDLAKGIELTSPTGRPLVGFGLAGQCAAKIRDEIAPAGVNHMVLAITDRSLVKAFTGMDIEGVADVNTQLQLIHDEVIPAV